MLATLALKAEGLAMLRDAAGIKTDSDLADRIGLDRAQVSRVLTGKSGPGPKFIAGLLDTFGIKWFTHLFAVVSDEDQERAA